MYWSYWFRRYDNWLISVDFDLFITELGARQVSQYKLSLLSKYSVAIYFTDSFKIWEIHPSLCLSFQEVYYNVHKNPLGLLVYYSGIFLYF